MLTALSISLDELAVGFSIGLVGVPVALTIILVALQAFIFTFFGLTFGSKLKRYLGEWSEKLAGIILGLLGLWILIDASVQLAHR
ncbi:manganese efflux pump [Alicyclobacillus fastidiosus]|uniref:Manganese efflux pump n=1 Tax=Alicyclobacillus fastidiosus TaxID=392011 RepID=A0ABV5ALV8_9BACL|nr:manganese efflux pump [Alicyclobacillus fastidiosus]WEH11960.1 manganese efflux pump [Alicyclobacillus fastidiosus]